MGLVLRIWRLEAGGWRLPCLAMLEACGWYLRGRGGGSHSSAGRHVLCCLVSRGGSATAGVAWPVTLQRRCLQAGAAKVYAVEASGMAQFAKQLAAANPGEAAVWLSDQPAASQATSSSTP